jgi:hypothetical protein
VRRLLVPHLAVLVLGAAALRVAVVPAEVCPPVEPRAVRVAIAEAAAWLERGVRSDGRYTYGFDRKRDVVSRDYNITRHAGVMMGLYRLAAETGDEEALAAADNGLRFLRANLLRRDDWAAFAEPGQEARLGASALAVAALVHRRLATGDRAHDELLRALARFLTRQQLRDGSVLGYWSPSTGRPVPGRYAKFGTGEALWALALVDRLFPGEGWDRAALRLAAYLATRRDDAEGYVLTFPDHWAAYGLAELDPRSLGEAEVAYARRLAGIFGLMSRLESQSGGGGLRRLLRGEPASGAGLGTIGEGLAGLWRLSRADPRLADLSGDLAERVRCRTSRTVARQAGAAEARTYPRPELVRGAWFSEDGYTQMDDQRALGAPGGAASARGAPPVSSGLLLVALVTAVNPCRTALGLVVPLRALALGSLVALAAAAALAATGGGVLDVLDVSPESFRLAAGAVLALEGARSLVVARPAAEPELPGLGAALVPVAFPRLLQPGVVTLALAAGGDGVAWEAIGALAVALALFCAAGALPRGTRAEGLLAAGGRLGAALELAAGVALADDAIRDV